MAEGEKEVTEGKTRKPNDEKEKKGEFPEGGKTDDLDKVIAEGKERLRKN